MKIEKLNDNQIRCILDKNDLDKRELHLSELAYGSTKAKALFRDMMEQASAEFGFEVDNIPLMIEAIPVSFDCLILVVTKVEDPEELDTRFSRFSSMNLDEDDDFTDEEGTFDEDEMDFGNDPLAFDENTFPFGEVDEEEIPFGESEDEGDENSNVPITDSSALSPSDDAGESVDIIGSFSSALAKAKQEFLKKKKRSEERRPLSDQIFAFDSLDDVIHLSGHLTPFYKGGSVLYKDTLEQAYYLVLLREESDTALYDRACMICSDHGECIQTTYASLAYFTEHFQMICSENALQTLHHLNG